MFQLAIILAAAKIGGEIAERYLKIPSVLGELAAGILIGPFALGSIDIWNYGPMFPIEHLSGSHSVPVSQSMWSIAQIGSVVLLFGAGLETNLRQFIKYAKPALVVAIGGVIIPFALGSSVTVLFGFADGFSDPKALFMGTILTATSIGISVRVLGDMRVLDTPEGITTLAAAVVDDIIGILCSTISEEIMIISGDKYHHLKGVLFSFGMKVMSGWLSRIILRIRFRIMLRKLFIRV